MPPRKKKKVEKQASHLSPKWPAKKHSDGTSLLLQPPRSTSVAARDRKSEERHSSADEEAEVIPHVVQPNFLMNNSNNSNTSDDDNEDSNDESDSDNNPIEVMAVRKGTKSNDDGSSTNQSENEDNDDDNGDDADGNKLPANNKSSVAPMSVATMKKKLSALQRTNTLLVRQVKGVTRAGTANMVELAAVRKTAKEDLFKKVKFITTAKLENSAMKYLATGFHVKEEERNQWQVTYAHAVREALNNKRNNVAQQLKMEVKGKLQEKHTSFVNCKMKRAANQYVCSLTSRTRISE